ncbi:S41 family peptidase [Myxococcaceae bacterium GXIMD 01537]
MSSTRISLPGPEVSLESLRRIRLFESRDEKRLLVNQLEVLLEQFYVHLPLKERTLGVRPLQEARRLQERVEDFPDDASFLEAVQRLTTGLGDFHTLLCLPEPWAGRVAVLPFQFHEYFDGSGAPRYLVGPLAPEMDWGGDFVGGVEVTHWNGEPLVRVLQHLAKRTAGANPPARRRRALESLTRRVLKYGPPPDEDFVLLGYTGKKGPAEIRLPWLLQEEGPPGPPECLSFRSVESPSGTLGYLRLASFMRGDAEAFVREVESAVRLLPETGLVIDVRGNPGGSIPASERLLQFFSPSRIEPAPFSFRCTDLTRRLSETHESWSPWRASLRRGVLTGEPYSEGIPLTPVEQANSVGRLYRGPVVLLCDALSYSATDLFIAGFKDHHLGPVIGVDARTGAGGSSAYWHQRLVQDHAHEPDSPLKPLPGGVAMHVALLRATRVGAKRGRPVEGWGTEIDIPYRSTRDDVLHGDVDLLKRAGQVLASRS